jgi:hypothetical protein
MILKNPPIAIGPAGSTIGVDVEIPSGTPLVSIGNLVGDLAPSLTLSALDGETVSLCSYHDRVVILYFYFWDSRGWTTACPPCASSGRITKTSGSSPRGQS